MNMSTLAKPASSKTLSEEVSTERERTMQAQIDEHKANGEAKKKILQESKEAKTVAHEQLKPVQNKILELQREKKNASSRQRS